MQLSQRPGSAPPPPRKLLLELQLRDSFPLEVLDSLLEILESQLPAAVEGGGRGQKQRNMRIRHWWLCGEQK